MTFHRLTRTAFALALASGIAAPAMAQQESATKLFKVITAKDEVTIGLSAAELHAMGTAPDIDNLAQKLASAGQIAVWQYAVQRAPDGSTAQMPLRRIAIFKTDTLRLEPYNPAPLKVTPVPAGDTK